MGTVYMGSPNSQPAKVVFDTGSEYLAVTSLKRDLHGLAGLGHLRLGAGDMLLERGRVALVEHLHAGDGSEAAAGW